MRQRGDITPDGFADAVINALTNNRPGTVPGETHGPLLPNLNTNDGLQNLFENTFNQQVDNSKPLSFLNVIVYDEQMQVLPDQSKIYQIADGGIWHTIGNSGKIGIPQTGYISVFVSNFTASNVFYNNITFTHYVGNLEEEMHYYPFGLPMHTVMNSKELHKGNRHKYQGNEYIEELGLNWMDFHARQYDPQIGRFLSIDPLADAYGQQVYSTYSAMGNAPSHNIDPNGEAFQNVMHVVGADMGNYLDSETQQSLDRLANDSWAYLTGGWKGNIMSFEATGGGSGGGGSYNSSFFNTGSPPIMYGYGGLNSSAIGNLFKNIGKAFGSLFGKKHKAKIANHALELGIAGEGSSKKAEESVTGQASVGGQNTDNSKVPYVVIVLQNPDGANIGYPQGHTALLIGNYDEGFTYISKNGALGSVGSSGEPDVVNQTNKYSSLTDFTNNNKDGNVYKDMLVYYTTKDVAEKVLAGSIDGAYKKYNVISSNCVGTVLDGLYRAGLTNINPNAQNTHQPNRIFLELVNEKKGEYYNIKR